jgi:Fe2+ or Zn2+ uptake regulation protein
MPSAGDGAGEDIIRGVKEGLQQTIQAIQHKEPIPKRVLEYIQNKEGEELTDKDIAHALKERYTNIRQATYRLYKKQLVRRIKRGHFITYTCDKLSDIEMTEKEHLLQKLIAPNEFIQTEPNLHNVSFTMSAKEIKGFKPEVFKPDAQCDKTIGGLSGALITDVLNPLSEQGIYQRWDIPKWSKAVPVKGGTSEVIEYEKGITITFQIFGTGTWQCFINATENTMPIPKYFIVCDYINAVMKSRCGYTMDDLKDYIGVRFEFNKDIKMGDVGVDSSGKYCITLRTANGLFVRVYSKYKEKPITDEGEVREEWLRQEVGTRDEGVPYNQFMSEVGAMMMGGVSAQWMVRNQHVQEQVNKGLMDNLNRIGNAVEFLLKENQKLKKQIEDVEKGGK